MDALGEHRPQVADCFAEFAPILRDMMPAHSCCCPVCRDRGERTARFAKDRCYRLPDDSEGSEAQGVVYTAIVSPLGTLWIGASIRTAGRSRRDQQKGPGNPCSAATRVGEWWETGTR